MERKNLGTNGRPSARNRLIGLVAVLPLLLLVLWTNEAVSGVDGRDMSSVAPSYAGTLSPNSSSDSTGLVVPTTSGSSSTQAVGTTGQTPSRFGVWMGNGDARRVDFLKGSGAKWTRIMVFWSQIEPTYTVPPSYDFGYYHSLFAALGSAGINVITEVRGNPDWAASTVCGPVDKPGGREAFARFVGALVGRYSQPPYNVKHWEFYNEPDNTDMGEIGTFLGGCWGRVPDAYVSMLEVARSAAKQVDPEAKVVVGGLAHEDSPPFNLSFLDQILAAGVGRYAEIMNIHYYTSFGPVWAAYGPDITGKVAAVRETMSRYQVSMPIMLTESSWTSSPRDSADLFEKQAQYAPKLLARSAYANLYAALWFSLMDWSGVDYPYGLADDNMRTRPSYSAFQVATAEFGQFRSVRPLLPDEVGATGEAVEGYAFAVGDQERWVLWSPAEVAQIRLPGRAIKAKDKFGSAIPLSGNGTPTTVNLGSSPIYVHLTPLPPRVWIPLVVTGSDG